MSKKTNEVAVQEALTPAQMSANLVPEELRGAFDTSIMGAQADSEDIVVPKIWLLQPTSDCVSDDKHPAQAGEYRNSRTLELIAEKGQGFEVLVLDNYKVWQEFKEVEVSRDKKTGEIKTEMQYQETKDYYTNSELPYDDTDTYGAKVHRDLVMGFFVLLMSEVQKGVAFPYIVDFKRTSRDAGKDLATYISKLSGLNVPSYGKVFTIAAEFEKNDKGQPYFVKKVNEGRWITKPELESIMVWARELQKNKQSGKFKVDDSDIKRDKEAQHKKEEAIATTARKF